MRLPHPGEALGLGFHHRAEVVAAIGALLLQVEADRGHVIIADRFGKHVAVTLGAERALDRVRGEQGENGAKRGQVHLFRSR